MTFPTAMYSKELENITFHELHMFPFSGGRKKSPEDRNKALSKGPNGAGDLLL
jgi:hypothetical protein